MICYFKSRAKVRLLKCMSFPLCDSIPRAYVVLIICFCYKIRQKLAHLKKKQYLCPRKGLNTMTTQTKMFNFTPPQ